MNTLPPNKSLEPTAVAAAVASMKLYFKGGFTGLLSIETTKCVFYLTRWHYHLFKDPFVFWKFIINCCVPFMAALIWWWIIQKTFKPRNNDSQDA